MSAKPAANFVLLLALGVVAILSIGHAPMLHAPFFADDFSHVVGTQGDHAETRVAASLTGPWYGIDRPFYYRPLPVLSYVASGHLTGLEPFAWRLPSLLLTALHALLLAAAVTLLMRRLRPGAADSTRSRLAGALAALLYAATPAAIEPVGWVSARDGALLHAFGLAAWCLTLANRRWLALVALGFAFGCKELALCHAAVCGLLAATLAVRESTERSIRAGVSAVVPYATIAILYLAFRYLRFGELGTGFDPSLTSILDTGGIRGVVKQLGEWFVLALAPLGSDLLGDAAPWIRGALAATQVAILARFVVHCGVLRAVVTYGGAAVVAIVLLGPALLVIPFGTDLTNGRFVPGLALPLACAGGIALAASRAPRVWIGIALAVMVTATHLFATAWRIAADDLRDLRDRVIAGLASETIPTPGIGLPLMILDPPASGLAAWMLKNTSIGFLERPLANLPTKSVPIRTTTAVEIARARLAPEFAPFFERPVVLLPPGTPRAVDGSIAGFVARHLRFERLTLGEPLVLRRGGDLRLTEHDTHEFVIADPRDANVTSARPAATLDPGSVAALEIELATTPAAPIDTTLVIHGGADRHVTLPVRLSDRVTVVPLEQRLNVVALGALTRVDLALTDASPHIARVSARGSLPPITVVAPVPPVEFVGDPPALLEFAFRPPFPCDRYRVALAIGSTTLLSDGLTADRIEREADGVFVLRFEQNRLGGRRSTIDWRWVHREAAGREVRWFLEGLIDDESDPAGKVVCRSRFLTAKVR